MKRGITGVYHHVSPQHLKRYLAEFDFRYNSRSVLGIADDARADRLVRGIMGKRLLYKDSSDLLLMLRPDTPVPAGPDGVPIDKPKERIDYLVQQLDKAKTKIIIPTPASVKHLSEQALPAHNRLSSICKSTRCFASSPLTRGQP